MKRNIIIGSFLLWELCIALTAAAQDGGVGSPKSAPLPSPSIGIEGGFSEYTQNGSILCSCGISFPSGTGIGFIGNIFYDYPIGRDFSAGLKAGLDDVNTSYSAPLEDDVNNVYAVKLALLKFEPYIQYQILHSSLFTQVGIGISYPLSNRLTETWEVTSDTVKLSNGATSQTIQTGSIINFATKLLYSGVISFGYNFDLFGLTILPIVSYDSQLTINQGKYYNVAFTSFKFLLGVKYNIQ